jgi:HEAT repeat protein
MDNPSLSTKSIYSARESIERFGGVKLIRSIRDANQNCGAVAIVNRKNGTDVYVVEAVSRLDIGEMLKTSQSIDMARAFIGMTDQAERVKAVKSLGALNKIDTIFTLVPLLSDSNTEVASEALKALDMFTDPCLIGPLIGYLDRVAKELQPRVAASLARLTGRKDFGTDVEKWRKWFAQQWGAVEKRDTTPAEKTNLSEKDIRELVDEYNKEYKDADNIGKIDAIKRISGIRHKKVAKAISKALGHKDPMVRKAAAEALISQAEKSTTPALIKAFAFNEPFPDIQLAIIQALGANRDPRAVPVLAKDLVDPRKAELTKARIEAMGNIKDKRCIDELISFMWKTNRGNRAHRRPLQESLKKLTGRDYGNDRRAWKDWWERSKKWFRFPKD